MSGCAKRTYPTWGDAVGGALAGSRKSGARLRLYWCDPCRGWHLTHKPKLGPL